MFRAIFFDFDYTLGDSTNGIILSVNYALEKLGYNIKETEEIKKTIGLSLKDTYTSLTRKDVEEEAEIFSKYFKEKADLVMVENTIFYKDSKEILQKLKKSGYAIGIITTKYHYRIEQILSKQQFTSFFDIRLKNS